MDFFEDNISSEYVFFSIVGSHAGEEIQNILERKENDIRNAGESFWVAKTTKKDREAIKNIPKGTSLSLVLIESANKGKAAQPTKIAKKAKEFSTEDEYWQPLPPHISAVTGNINNGATAFYCDKYEKGGQVVDLNDYVKFNGEPIRFNQFTPTILAKSAKGKKTNALKSSKRKVVAILRLKSPCIVHIK